MIIIIIACVDLKMSSVGNGWYLHFVCSFLSTAATEPRQWAVVVTACCLKVPRCALKQATTASTNVAAVGKELPREVKREGRAFENVRSACYLDRRARRNGEKYVARSFIISNEVGVIKSSKI